MPVVGYYRNFHANLCPCFICCKKYSLDNGVEDLLTHICFTHKVVIENVDRIADFQKYMEYYANRLKDSSIQSFTKEVTLEVPNAKDNGLVEKKYYILGDSLPEDEALRKSLHAQRLNIAQKQQKKDQSPKNYTRHCFYCHQMLDVTNMEWVDHMRSHGFQLGHPGKLVYIEKFLEAIENTFRCLRCLYCNNEFDSSRTLINHMEVKGHLKIHSNDRFFDQFYMINYIEFGKTWLDFIKPKQKSASESENINVTGDADWSCWGTDIENILCLFCQHVCKSWDGALLHLQVSHNFDFKSKTADLSFYQQVKLVNYIRRKMQTNCCLVCDFQGENIMGHMEKNNHFAVPESKLWDLPEYFFCTLENDMFLCHLEEGECFDNCPETGSINSVSAENLINCHFETNLDAEFMPRSIASSENSDVDCSKAGTLVPEIEENLTECLKRVVSISSGAGRFANKVTQSQHDGSGDSIFNLLDKTPKENMKKVYEYGDS